MGRRPNKPKRRFPGVSAVWSEGVWKWRALLRVDGRQVVGTYQATQEEAYADRQRMGSTRAVLPKEILTLGVAIDAVVAAARARGLPEDTITKTFRAHGNYLLKFWRAETALTQIDAKEIEWFITEAGKSVDEEGKPKPARSPNTLRQKDLPLLRRCFEVAELPVPEFQPPKGRPPELRYFEMKEVAALIERIRREPFKDKHGNEILVTARERHADLLQLVAQSGVRAGEMGRITGADVDLKRQRIRIREPKDRSNPRYIEITPGLIPVVTRLLPENAEDLLVPGGMNTISNLCRHWKRRLKEPRLSGRTLRHSFCTAQLAAGVPLNQVQSLMGHRSIRSTDRYIHAIDSGRKQAASRLDRFFEPRKKKAK
jgi:integrase